MPGSISTNVFDDDSARIPELKLETGVPEMPKAPVVIKESALPGSISTNVFDDDSARIPELKLETGVPEMPKAPVVIKESALPGSISTHVFDDDSARIPELKLETGVPEMPKAPVVIKESALPGSISTHVFDDDSARIPELKLETGVPEMPKVPVNVDEGVSHNDERKAPGIIEQAAPLASEHEIPKITAESAQGALNLGGVRKGEEGDFIRFEFAGAKKAFYFPPSLKNDDAMKLLENDFISIIASGGSDSEVAAKQELVVLEFLKKNSQKNGVDEVAVAIKDGGSKWNLMTNGNIDVDVYSNDNDGVGSLNKVASIEGVLIGDVDKDYIGSICSLDWGGQNAVLSNYEVGVKYAPKIARAPERDRAVDLMILSGMRYASLSSNDKGKLSTGMFYNNAIEICIEYCSQNDNDRIVDNYAGFKNDIKNGANDPDVIGAIIDNIVSEKYIKSGLNNREGGELVGEDNSVFTSNLLGIDYIVDSGYPCVKSLREESLAAKIGLKDGDIFDIGSGEYGFFSRDCKKFSSIIDDFVLGLKKNSDVYLIGSDYIGRKVCSIDDISKGKDAVVYMDEDTDKKRGSSSNVGNFLGGVSKGGWGKKIKDSIGKGYGVLGNR